MADYAIINAAGLVTNVIVADPEFIAASFPGAVQIDGLSPVPGIGWSWANGAFTAPAPAAPSNPVFQKVDFLALFTSTELQAIANYATNTGLSAATIQQLNVFQQYFDAATTVTLTDPRTVAGVELLEASGLIGQGRAAQILASRH